jgi:hypothetical protein
VEGGKARTGPGWREARSAPGLGPERVKQAWDVVAWTPATEGKRKGLKRECWRRSRERKEPWIMPTTKQKATESPWFLVKGKNLLVREVSFSLLLLALLEWTKDRPTGDARGFFVRAFWWVFLAGSQNNFHELKINFLNFLCERRYNTVRLTSIHLLQIKAISPRLLVG